EQKHGGIQGERTSDLDHLLLSEREVRGLLSGQVGQVELGQDGVRPGTQPALLAYGARRGQRRAEQPYPAAEVRADHDVLPGVHTGEQARRLERACQTTGGDLVS